ncbi:MAG TPA: trigger factor [Polyangiales bacterium]|nr:trigger factor [Polyangiales bacterium]
MQSHVETLSPVLVEVKVEVPWQKVAEDLESAYRIMQRKAHIRGFRPGKVPREVVKNVLGKSIRADVTAELVRQSLGKAVEEHKLEPVAYQDLTPANIQDGAPLTFTAKLEVRPKIESVDSSGIEVERAIDAIQESAVDAEIDRMRERAAELITPEPARASQAGDVVTVDLKVSVDGEDRPAMGGAGRKIELGSGKLLPDLEAGLTGVEIGQTREIRVQFPDDYGYDELKGKAALFNAVVQNIQAKELPAIDDELAKDLGHDSLDALKQSIRERFEKEARERADSAVREAVVEKLVDKNPVPVPPSLIDQELRSMLEQYLRLQYMFGQQGEIDEALQKDFRERAERKVRAGLLFGAIARAENIEVQEADLEARIRELAERSGKHVAKVRAEYQGEQKRSLELQVLEKKLLEYLVSRATIKDVVAAPPATTATQEANP